MRERRRVEAVTVDGDADDADSLAGERGPRLDVAGVLERHRAADQAQGGRQRAQRGSDAGHDEEVVRVDGDPAAAAQVLGEHLPQPGVRWSRSGVVPGHDRSGDPPGPAPRGRVDERGVGAAGPQVPPRRRVDGGAGAGLPGVRGVHVGHRAGHRGPVGSRCHDDPGPRPAHDEARGGELVVGGDDRPAGEPERRGERAGRGQGVPGAQPAGAQLGDDRVGDAVAQGRRAVGDVEGELDGAGCARHPSTILVLRISCPLDLGVCHFVRWTGGSWRPSGRGSGPPRTTR